MHTRVHMHTSNIIKEKQAVNLRGSKGRLREGWRNKREEPKWYNYILTTKKKKKNWRENVTIWGSTDKGLRKIFPTKTFIFCLKCFSLPKYIPWLTAFLSILKNGGSFKRPLGRGFCSSSLMSIYSGPFELPGISPGTSTNSTEQGLGSPRTSPCWHASLFEFRLPGPTSRAR